MLRKAQPDCFEQDAKKLIEAITNACATCAEISDRPISFSVGTPDDVKFNEELLIDIMYFNNRSILHVTDRGTLFSAAKYLRKADAKTVWNTFVQTCSLLYVGHPKSILTDQGSVFRREEWKGMCMASDIKLRFTGTESHNSLNAGESLHSSLRRILSKLEHEHPDMQPDVALSIAVYNMNCTVNADSLCPMLLVFGTMPPIPSI